MIKIALWLIASPCLFMLYHIGRNQKAPADTSNRINKIRLLWFGWTRSQMLCRNAGIEYKGRLRTFWLALTDEGAFAKSGGLPWLMRDEAENVGLK